MRKIIVSGNIIEIYDSDMYVVGKGGHQETKELEQQEKNYQQQTLRRNNNVRRLITRNFNENDKFFSLTFRKNITDLNYADNEFKKFIKRLKYQYCLNDLKYLAVIEFQKRGAIHYHIICNLPFIPHEELQELWGHGFVWINCIENVDNIGAYIVKYMTKETADKRLQNHKGYLCSKGLKRPLEVSNMSNKNRDLFTFYNNMVNEKIKNIAPVYESEYENEFLGKTKYKQYNLNKK